MGVKSAKDGSYWDDFGAPFLRSTLSVGTLVSVLTGPGFAGACSRGMLRCSSESRTGLPGPVLSIRALGVKSSRLGS